MRTKLNSLNPDLRKILGNTIWLFTDKVLRLLLGLVVGVWVARYLGVEQFGALNYALAWVALFTTLATLGLEQVVVRDMVRHSSSKEELMGTTFGLKFLGAVTAMVVCFTSVATLRPGDTLMHWLVGLIAFSMVCQSFDVIDFWFQAQVQSKYTVWAKNIALIAANLAKILLIQLKAPLVFFAAIYSLEVAVSAIALIWIYQQQGHSVRRWRYSFQRARYLLGESWTLILSGFAIIVYMRTDQVMLGQMLGDQAVGIYSAAVRVSELWYFVPGAIFGSVYPMIIDAKQISETLYYQRIGKTLTLTSLISYSFALVISLFSTYIITLLFGQDYQAAGPILVIHVWVGVFVSLGMVRSQWTTIEGLMQFAFIATAIGAVINIVLNFLLIKPYGGIGAAIATLISQAFASYLSGSFFPRTRRIFIAQTKALLLPNPTLLLKLKSL